MRLLLVIILSTYTTTWGQSLKEQKINPSDSIEVKRKIEAFYDWYAQLIKDGKVGKEFNPTFTRTKTGMTGLDFSKYVVRLKEKHFTDNFIKKKIKDYQPCVDNLAKIKYETFLDFEDISQFEEIKCDFSNINEWTQDMEPHDGAELIELTSNGPQELAGTIIFYNITQEGKRSIWDHKKATVLFRFENNEWKINNVSIERL